MDGYTYVVTLERYNVMLQLWVAQSFRTTDDAVSMHQTALGIQQRAGHVRNVVFRELETTH